MFDIATRAQPSRPAGAVLSVPFDWRLTAPQASAQTPFTDYSSGSPMPGVEVLATYALALEDTLATAVAVSLFTDRRAGRDDVLPFGQVDRRGWVGDEFMRDGFDTRSDAWGTLLWLLYVSKASAEVLEAARFTAAEGLQWMVRAGLASRIEVAASWAGAQNARLALRVTIYQPESAQPVYDVLWGTTLQRSAGAAA